jgi:hypothetical protein
MRLPHEVLFYRTKMTALQLKHFIRDVLFVSESGVGYTYGANQCLLVWVGQLLEQVPALDPHQRRQLLDEIRGPIDVLGDGLGRIVDADRPVEATNWVLAFADRRYATWTGRVGFLDLTTGDGLLELPRPALTTTAFNIVEVFVRNLRRCQQLQRTLAERRGRDASDLYDEGEAPAAVDG